MVDFQPNPKYFGGPAGPEGKPAPLPPAGTAAMLTAGTDTTARTWSAKELVAFFAKKTV